MNFKLDKEKEDDNTFLGMKYSSSQTIDDLYPTSPTNKDFDPNLQNQSPNVFVWSISIVGEKCEVVIESIDNNVARGNILEIDAINPTIHGNL